MTLNESTQNNFKTYIPIYSHIYAAEGKAVPFSVTISLRNISTTQNLTIYSVKLYNTNGSAIREYLSDSINIPPLGTQEYFIAERDNAGGSGSNFIIESSNESSKNLSTEAIMLGNQGTQGFSFVTRGKPIQ